MGLALSGGGYIESSLTLWLREGSNVGLGTGDFPFGCDRETDTATDTSAQKRLRHLSQHGKFLTPGTGITLLSRIAIVLRTISLNLVVWLPSLIVVTILLIRGSADLAGWFAEGRLNWMPPMLPQALPVWDDEAFIFQSLLHWAVLLAVIFVAFCLVYSLRTAAGRGPTSSDRYKRPCG